MTFSMSMLYHYAECGIFFTTMINVIMLSVVMLNVVVLNVWVPAVGQTFYYLYGLLVAKKKSLMTLTLAVQALLKGVSTSLIKWVIIHSRTHFA